MITVRYEHDDHFHIDVRHHGLVVDQPRDDGGDLGPTPVELFVASIAACSAHYARRFLTRHQQPTDGLVVECAYEMSTERPARVVRIDISLKLPASLPPELRAPLIRVVDHCTVKNSLAIPPIVALDVAVAEKVA